MLAQTKFRPGQMAVMTARMSQAEELEPAGLSVGTPALRYLWSARGDVEESYESYKIVSTGLAAVFFCGQYDR